MDNIELIRAGFDAHARRDPSWLREHGAEDLEWWPALGLLLSREVYRGPDEALEVIFDEIPAVLRDFRSDVVELEELDEENVLATVKFAGTAVSSGMEIEQVFGQIYTVRGGKVVSMRSYPSKAEALAAVGRSEPA